MYTTQMHAAVNDIDRMLVNNNEHGVAERREASKGPTIFDDPWVGNKLFSEFLTAHVSLKLGVASFLKAVLVSRAV